MGGLEIMITTASLLGVVEGRESDSKVLGLSTTITATMGGMFGGEQTNVVRALERDLGDKESGWPAEVDTMIRCDALHLEARPSSWARSALR